MLSSNQQIYFLPNLINYLIILLNIYFILMLFSFQISQKIIFVNSQQNISSSNNFLSLTTKNLISNEIFNNNFKLQKEQNKWKRFRRRNEKIRGRKRRFFGVINSDDDEDYQQQQQVN